MIFSAATLRQRSRFIGRGVRELVRALIYLYALCDKPGKVHIVGTEQASGDDKWMAK